MVGSLHSMSYLEPYRKYKRFLAWFQRSQICDIHDQYEKYNVRAFDLHLDFVGSNKLAVFRQGSITFKTFSVYEILNYLNKQDNVYVRVVLEDECKISMSRKVSIDKENRFYEYCGTIETIYPNIKFFGGYRECDSKKIYKFKNDCPTDVIFYERVDKLYKTKAWWQL